MRKFVYAALLIVALSSFVGASVAYAGDCCQPKCKQHSCTKCDKPCGECKHKCDSCKPKCEPCKPKCEPCKPKCDPCKPKCEPCKPKCDTCKPKCEPCKPKCDPCKPKCEKACKPKCDPCKPKCESKCDPCKPKCESKCNPCKPKCESKCDPCKPKCSPCKPKCEPCKPKCGECEEKACAKPCACMAWMPYCGCESVTSLCFTIETACDGGTASPLTFVLRDKDMKTVASIELAGPIDGYYTYTYTFAEPMKADLLHEAVLINTTDDPLTITHFSVVGNWECGSWTYIDHTCPGAVVGPGGCPRMVMF